ncbi:substrate-binding domain-containing protein, partial [Klebsiella pneumoniae]
MNYRNIFITLAALSGTATASAWSAESATVAFLMPDQASTRYEQHDFPGFKAEMSKLCADCKVIYQNANANASLQQQQFNSVIAQGAKVIVLDPVDS